MRTKKIEEKWWDSENLRTLVENSGMTQKSIAEASGIPMASFRLYLSEEIEPPVSRLIALADLFAVPLDYIFGRCTKEECDVIEESFADNFRLLRRKDYEKCTLKLVETWKKPNGYESPYPYNLLDDIFGAPFDHMLSEDEENGLNCCIRTLSEREQIVIGLRYEKEMTLDEAGKELNLAGERVRQIQAKALRKLRHPSIVNYICYGEKTNRRRLELMYKEAELKNRERTLEEAEKQFEEAKKQFEQNFVASVEQKRKEFIALDEKQDLHGCSEAFLCLDWSTRAYNCLRRKGLTTVRDVLDAVRTPDKYHIHDSSVMRIRNVGAQVYTEILNKIELATGEDLSDYRAGYNIFNDYGKLNKEN